MEKVIKYILIVGSVFSLAAVAADLRDPTLPLTVPGVISASGGSTAVEPYRLQAVFISAEEKVAVINAALYREGDDIDGYTVGAIEVQSVSLRSSGSVKKLWLYPELVDSKNQ